MVSVRAGASECKSSFFSFLIPSITTPQVERKFVTGMEVVTTSQVEIIGVQVEGHFVTDGVCVVVTTLAQSSFLPKSACRVVLNVPVGMLIGNRSAVQRKTTQHGFFPDRENFLVTPNGVLTAHTEWLPGV